jgi:hypothetical protein
MINNEVNPIREREVFISGTDLDVSNVAFIVDLTLRNRFRDFTLINFSPRTIVYRTVFWSVRLGKEFPALLLEGLSS